MKTIQIFTVLCAALLLALGALTAPTSATEIPAGPVSGAWTAVNNPYNINGEIYVQAGSPLTIEPGVQVFFQGHYKFIVETDATLLAVGTAELPISFDVLPPNTTWHGIRFLSASNESRLDYCIMKHGYRQAGSHEVTFDGSNLASGIYLYTMTAGQNTTTGKMVLMK